MNQETIGKNIRKARRDRDMTQDELAAMLNVSESAVSQWESGKTSPDLGIIPDLCTVLEISADWLLGVDQEKKRKEVEEIVERAHAYHSRGRDDRAAEILEEGLKRFPGNEEIIFSLMDMEGSTERRIEQGEWVLAHSSDENKRQRAIQALVYAYNDKGLYSKAEEMARTMPCLWVTSDVLLTHIAEGEQYIRQSRTLRFALVNLLYEALHYGIVYGRNNEEPPEERIGVAEKAIAYFDLFFEDGDFGFHHGSLQDEYTVLAKEYARKGDAAKTLEYLGKAADHALAFIDYVYAKKGEYKFTSFLFRGAVNEGSVSFSFSENSAQGQLDEMQNPVYDFICNTEDFQAIIARLTSAAGEWEIKEPEKTE